MTDGESRTITWDVVATGEIGNSYEFFATSGALESSKTSVLITEDTTTGAFAFKSPTDDEWSKIGNAYTTHSEEIPSGAGYADSDFPTLTPIQILLLSNIWKYSDGKSSFIFARKRTSTDPAITLE